MPTNPTMSVQRNKLTVTIKPTLPAVPTISMDLVCYAYVLQIISNACITALLRNYVTLNMQKSVN